MESLNTLVLLFGIGGLLWGLNVDHVAAATGSAVSRARFVYPAVGLAAVYQLASLRSVQRRWTFSAVGVS